MEFLHLLLLLQPPATKLRDCSGKTYFVSALGWFGVFWRLALLLLTKPRCLTKAEGLLRTRSIFCSMLFHAKRFQCVTALPELWGC